MLRDEAPIVKCSHCKQIFAIEQFDTHKCDIPLNDVKEIPVAFFVDESYNDKKIMTGLGIDGILYSLVVEERKAIPIIEPTRRFFTDNQSDDNFTEPKIVRFIY